MKKNKKNKGYRSIHEGGVFRDNHRGITAEQLAVRLIEQIKKNEPDLNPTYDESSLEITNDRDDRTFYIGNLLSKVKDSSKAVIDQQVTEYARIHASLNAPRKSYSNVRDRIFPRIVMRQEAESEVGRVLLSRPLADQFSIQLYEETEDGRIYLSKNDLGRLEVLEAELFDLALRNIRNRASVSDDPNTEPGKGQIHIWGIGRDKATGQIPLHNGTDCNGDAGLILVLTDIGMDLPVKGKPVVMIPTATSAYMTGDEDIEGLRLMAEIGRYERAQSGTDPMSGIPIRYNGAKWETFIGNKNLGQK